jgi:biopolymer transport protein ExbD
VADADQQRDHPKEVVVAVAADGRYAVNRTGLEGKSVDVLAAALQSAAKAGPGSIVIISADATAPHQSVVTVMEAARRVGLTQITFATQSSASAGAGKP